MFLLFLILSFSLKPVVLVPGFTGSTVYATILDKHLYPQCPDLPSHFAFYPYNTTFLNKYSDCNGIFMSTYYNKTTNNIESPPGILVETAPFGDVSTLPSYRGVVDRLVSEGYEVNNTLYGYPYNWILYYTGIPGIFQDLKEKIEIIHKIKGEKIILFGHSMGAHVVRMLLNNYTEKHWVKTHIDRILYNAPAFYGCSDLLRNIVSGKLESDEYYEGIANATRSMPSAYLLLDNYRIIKEKAVFRQQNGKNVYPRDVKNFLKEKGIINENAFRVFNSIEQSLDDDIFEEPPVPAILFYNSALATPYAYDTSNLDRYLTGAGDGACQSDVVDKVCEKWKNTKCIDWKINDEKFGHVPMLRTKEELDIISDFIFGKNKNEL